MGRREFLRVSAIWLGWAIALGLSGCALGVLMGRTSLLPDDNALLLALFLALIVFAPAFFVWAIVLLVVGLGSQS